MKLFLILITVSFVFSEDVDTVESIDLIDILVNNDSGMQYTDVDENINNGDKPVAVDNSGLWKCGRCGELGEAVYTEEYGVENKYLDDEMPTVIQIGLALDGMRCVTVSGDVIAGVAGSCAGAAALTVTVNGEGTITVNVYADV